MERERQKRDVETDRHTERHRDTEIQTQTDRQTDRQRWTKGNLLTSYLLKNVFIECFSKFFSATTTEKAFKVEILIIVIIINEILNSAVLLDFR